MSYLEIYYNANSLDWDAVTDAALERIDYIPSMILCYPREDKQVDFEFKPTDKAD